MDARGRLRDNACMQSVLGDRLTAALKEHFGYSRFRPLQREIVEAALEGSDVVALLPTGGGKSLCYQLPALMREGLTVVVSPLIALMKDQVDGLRENGIAAALLNSGLDEEESRQTWRALYRGEFKILYLSPERLLIEGMLDSLEKLNFQLLAVDEAHCISSWGHDFRPEYRGLSVIREHFPDVPILAFTATATGRVREDIVQMLELKDPKEFVASFNRPNLSYRIIPRLSPLKQILEVISEHPQAAGIIYCLSRARTESVAEELRTKGVKAEAYHAGLDPQERSERQERFVRDETQVIVATVAFGMGVDKPDVRFVIHHDLPKNLESYYQETGRAGRDGLPSECVLLYSAGDAAKLRTFIDQASDAGEREVAHAQLQQLLRFAESSECRRVALLRYFGEVFCDQRGASVSSCGACDNCLTPREAIDAAEITQKVLSCALRIQKHSGFSVGAGHLIDVLMGASTEKIKRWGHEKLSTYGIGKGRAKAEWGYYIRELVSAGLLRVNEQRFNVVEVTEEGLAALKERRAVTLKAPLLSSSLGSERRKQQRARLGEVAFDQGLFEKLRGWRIGVAKQRQLPAYMVFSDATLQAIARERPRTLAALAEISGVGEKKLAQYGTAVLEVVNAA